jgi:hypothetical protein
VSQMWDVEVGQTIRRTELHKLYGGGQRGGMEPSAKTPNVLLFTTPKASDLFGYKFDGWHLDGTFHYTGEGQFGDQVMTHGNKATLEHLEKGRALRLFRKDDVFVTYIGQFEVPDESFVLVDEAPDFEKHLRSVFVFRLVPVGETMPRTELVAPSPVVTSVIPFAEIDTESKTINGLDPSSEWKRQAELINRYSTWISATSSHELVRHEIPTPAGALMYTDLFDSTTGELIEARGSSSRHHIRSGLGELLDYGRYVESRSLTLLLPAQPAPEMTELLKMYDVGCIWETKAGAFTREV